VRCFKGDGTHICTPDSQVRRPVKGEFGKTKLYHILFPTDTTQLHTMLRGVMGMYGDGLEPGLARAVRERIIRVIECDDLRLKQVAVLLFMANNQSMKDYVCEGDEGNDNMQGEDNAKANRFFVMLNRVIHSIPRQCNPDASIIAVRIMRKYMKA
jgi:hypothetical protein